jgi:hypothetical protein
MKPAPSSTYAPEPFTKRFTERQEFWEGISWGASGEQFWSQGLAVVHEVAEFAYMRTEEIHLSVGRAQRLLTYSYRYTNTNTPV